MPRTTKENCLADLKRRILTLDLAPGSDLDEVSLSSEYGLSRTPLREVLQRLSGEGFVTIASNRGAKVASMDIATLRTFFQTAPTIYAHIARLAAENCQREDLEALRNIQKRFRKAVKSGEASAAALENHAFHGAIGDMARNPYLVACLERLLIDHTRLGQTFYAPTDQRDATLIETASAQHEDMIDALSSRDAETVVALTLKHWDLSRDRIERFVRPDPLPLETGGFANAV